jgi:hypothetical protein
MSEYKITTTDTQDTELDYLRGDNVTREALVQALLDQKLADLYPGFLAWQKKETWRKIQKLEGEDNATLQAMIARVDAAEKAEKEAAEAAALEPPVEGKPE